MNEKYMEIISHISDICIPAMGGTMTQEEFVEELKLCIETLNRRPAPSSPRVKDYQDSQRLLKEAVIHLGELKTENKYMREYIKFVSGQDWPEFMLGKEGAK